MWSPRYVPVYTEQVIERGFWYLLGLIGCLRAGESKALSVAYSVKQNFAEELTPNGAADFSADVLRPGPKWPQTISVTALARTLRRAVSESV